jgi:hypothetical protein
MHRSDTGISKHRLLARFILLFGAILFSESLNIAQIYTTGEGTTPSGHAPGAPAGSYELSGFDNINLL